MDEPGLPAHQVWDIRLLCRGGDVKIADFGAAQLTRSEEATAVGVGLRI